MPIEKIENLIDGTGCISLGSVEPVSGAANAADEDQCFFAKLDRFEGESLMDLLRRLDASIEDVYGNQIFAEEGCR